MGPTGHRAPIRCTVVLAVCVAVLLLGGCAPEEQASPIVAPSLSQEQLERAKLAAEIESIRSATERAESAGARVLEWAPFVTVLVALATLWLGWSKQRSELQASREKDRLEQRLERRRRRDATISETVKSLGSDNSRLRLNSAAALLPELRVSSDGVPAQELLAIAIANLRTETEADVLDALVDLLEVALVRLGRERSLPDALDLTRTEIRRLRLPPGIDLGAVDIAFASIHDSQLSECTAKRLRGYGADLSRTRLSRSNLHEARLNASDCSRTVFHEASLVSATFKRATLIGTQFQRAHLQGAHFESAFCVGAAFTGADLADAWFCNGRGDAASILDDSALRSINRAFNWRSAHFTAEHRAELERLSAETGGD